MCVGLCMAQSLLTVAHSLPSSLLFINHNLCATLKPWFVRTQALEMRPQSWLKSRKLWTSRHTLRAAPGYRACMRFPKTVSVTEHARKKCFWEIPWYWSEHFRWDFSETHYMTCKWALMSKIVNPSFNFYIQWSCWFCCPLSCGTHSTALVETDSHPSYSCDEGTGWTGPGFGSTEWVGEWTFCSQLLEVLAHQCQRQVPVIYFRIKRSIQIEQLLTQE